MIKVRRGMDLPIAGTPEQTIYDGPAVSQVALIGSDYHGMKPTMAVRQGDVVKKGQLLFTDKKNDSAKYVAPAPGTVAAINRGERRVFQSLVIDVEGHESKTFAAYKSEQLQELDRQLVTDQLVESGQWVAFRTRPFSKVPSAGSVASSIFVTAMDTNPLAADPTVIIGQMC